MKELLRQLQQKIRQKELDALLITNPANRRYISGFDGTSGVLLAGGEECYLVTDFRYTEQAREQAQHCRVAEWKESTPVSLAPLLEETGWRKIGFEGKHLTYDGYSELKEKLETAELVPAGGMVEEMRAVKSDAEAALLKRGAACLDRTFSHILSFLKPGLTELEVSLELEFHLRRQGATETSFRFIVASGRRGAMPHGVASSKRIASRELVTMDFGAVFDGYATDMTRTVCLGEPDGRQREVYEVVRRAQREALDGIRPGMTGKDADALAREVIKEAGFGEYFGHGLGHGVGLETHEQPTLSPRSETVLAPGMVVTVEPGVYIPGWGGVRIEDMVLVTPAGVETLTASDRDLIIL